MINFKETYENDNEVIFVNMKGQHVKSYPLEEIEKFVHSNGMNATKEDVKGSSWGGNPDFEEQEVEIEMSTWLDDQSNWENATKAFYIEKNPSEFKANNSYNDTKGVYCGI